ncbi:MAG: UvrD-helicase domain-containing protein [Candidatus Falkowbacteria bacterium]
MIDYKALLNDEQYEIVTKGDGPCLVLAGAGSGKTRTLVFRVAYLIEKGVAPENILLVTFTNKAAKEMMERVEKLLGCRPQGLWGGTFHHIANLILRKQSEKLGYKNNFNILDEDDSTSLIKKAMDDLGLNTKGQSFPKPNIIRGIISFSRNTNQDVREVAECNYGLPDFVAKKAEEIASAYETKKKTANVMDFDDLLVNWLKLLEKFPELCERYSRQFQHILVDEYQDTNYIQAEIIKRLAGVHKNILVVGDDSQSIYSFRAADVKNILNFPKLFIRAQIFKIETNYRSTPQILDLANEIIKHNHYKYPKNLQAKRGDGFMPMVVPCRDNQQQATLIIERIKELRNGGATLGQMAVLFRAAFHSVELQMELNRAQIPYVVRGGTRYFEQAHIKDVLAYLKILANFQDESAWIRVLKTFDGIGPGTIAKIWQDIKNQQSLADIFTVETRLPAKAAASWEKLRNIFERLLSLNQTKSGFIAEALDCVIAKHYSEFLRNNFENYRDRQEDLDELIDFVYNYESLDKLLADLMLDENFAGESSKKEARDAPPWRGEVLVLSTIHQAKGLEWSCVFVIGLRDGQFPHYKSLENAVELEEERRLFYVAATRAQNELVLLYPARAHPAGGGASFWANQSTGPSMFIKELDRKKYVTLHKFGFRWDKDETDEEVRYE